jgi:predicted deacylase
LGKNLGGYFGEPLNLPAFLRDLQRVAADTGWTEEVFLDTEARRLLALRRTALPSTVRVYISAGIHGDEPAGPLAILKLLEENQWPAHAEVVICPCLNPTGFALNRRQNMEGIDLNRQYHGPSALEVQAHIAWINKQANFDICVCLHEDWESHGFYVYELNPDRVPSFAPDIIKAVSAVCPIDQSAVIEGYAAEGGIIRPSSDPLSRAQWPEAFYLFTSVTRLTYTFEAPSDFTMTTRVAALTVGVRSVLDALSARITQPATKTPTEK